MPKPTKKKKHFIRKKTATTYRLIPDYVEDDEEGNQIPPEELEKRKEEQRNFGIFYNDDYNYMKHVRNLNEAASLVNTETFTINPDDETKSVRSQASMPRPFKEFFSTDETEEERIDPEILAALEEAPIVPLETIQAEEANQLTVKEGMDQDASDNFLDDDFLAQAGGVVEPLPKEEEYYDDSDFDGEDFSDEDIDHASLSDGSDRLGGVSDDDDDFDDRPSHGQRTRGTTEDDIIEAQTAQILRNFEEGLGFRLQDGLEDDVGETMMGPQGTEYLQLIMKQDRLKPESTSWSEILDNRDERAPVNKERYLYEDEDEYEWKEVPKPMPEYDAVSILSLRSNTRNLPTDIIPPSKPKSKAGSVAGEGRADAPAGLTLRQLEAEMRESRRADRASTLRPADETTAEKKARKKAIKDERKERRQEKKANKMVFSIENERMKKETAQLSKSVKNVRLS